MRFFLFSQRPFEVSHPVALIEAYCFQSNFYANYDLLLRKGDRRIQDVNEIGARIKEGILSECKAKVNKDLDMFSLSLDAFLKLDNKTRKNYIRELSEVVEELVAIEGIGFSKATKILHTLYPKIIPMIDNALQKEYQKINPQWRRGDWKQILIDYYDNFLVGDTHDNLCRVHSSVSFLGLTKVRIFDILWWSFLKAEKLREKENIRWTTIGKLT